MLVVTAHVSLKQGKGAEFVQKSQDCIDKTRQEQGNISYTLFENTEDDCKYTFFEEWDKKDSLEAHEKTAHFLALVGVLNELSSAPLNVKLYNSELL